MSVVKEFDMATKRKKGGFRALPERVGHGAMMPSGGAASYSPPPAMGAGPTGSMGFAGEDKPEVVEPKPDAKPDVPKSSSIEHTPKPGGAAVRVSKPGSSARPPSGGTIAGAQREAQRAVAAVGSSLAHTTRTLTSATSSRPTVSTPHFAPPPPSGVGRASDKGSAGDKGWSGHVDLVTGPMRRGSWGDRNLHGLTHDTVGAAKASYAHGFRGPAYGTGAAHGVAGMWSDDGGASQPKDQDPDLGHNLRGRPRR